LHGFENKICTLAAPGSSSGLLQIRPAIRFHIAGDILDDAVVVCGRTCFGCIKGTFGRFETAPFRSFLQLYTTLKSAVPAA